MGKYIKKFDTHSDYEEFIKSQDFIKPNVSYCEEQVDVHYNGLKPMMIIKYIGDGSNSVNILQKELNAFGDKYTLDEQSIDKMILDGNQIDFSDFTVVSNGSNGATSNVYTYVFNDTSEHTLKIFSNNSVPFRLSSWGNSGPSAPPSTYFSKVSEIILSDQITSISNGAFKCCTYLSSITIRDGVTSIGGGAFNSCISLASVIIPNSVTSIELSTFYGCSGLTSVTIGNSVTSIGNTAFKDCSSLTSITIPNSVTLIDNGAFADCSSMNTLTIGNSVTSIGDSAFQYCRRLTNITFNGTIAQWNDITKGSNWNLDVPATAVHCSDGDVTL